MTNRDDGRRGRRTRGAAPGTRKGKPAFEKRSSAPRAEPAGTRSGKPPKGPRKGAPDKPYRKPDGGRDAFRGSKRPERERPGTLGERPLDAPRARNTGRKGVPSGTHEERPFPRPKRTFGRSDEAPRERTGARKGAPRSAGEERPFARPKGPGGRSPKPFARKDHYRPEGDGRPWKQRPKRDKGGQRPGDGTIRLNRYLAQSGVASRREADDLIRAGVVTVNGVVVTELGTKVKPSDTVHYGGQRLSMEKPRYVLLNKPKGYITTTDDERGRRTVMSLVAGACPERLYPVGRLDRNTSGVLLLTNDGELAKRLTHPSHGAEKIYHVTLDKSVTKAHLKQLVEGVELEDGMAQADEANYVDGASKREVGVKLHMGRNRVVRRMFEALGYEVVKLDRVVFAGLTKRDLPRGMWRHLSPQEVVMLTRRKWGDRADNRRV